MKSDKKLDAEGLCYPMPVIEVATAMKNMKPSEILEVIATDPAFCPDIKVWTKKMNYKLLEVKEEDGITTVHIQKMRGGSGDR